MTFAVNVDPRSSRHIIVPRDPIFPCPYFTSSDRSMQTRRVLLFFRLYLANVERNCDSALERER